MLPKKKKKRYNIFDLSPFNQSLLSTIYVHNFVFFSTVASSKRPDSLCVNILFMQFSPQPLTSLLSNYSSLENCFLTPPACFICPITLAVQITNFLTCYQPSTKSSILDLEIFLSTMFTNIFIFS
jgi:hypothetical protein